MRRGLNLMIYEDSVQKKAKGQSHKATDLLVGVTRFELATSRPPDAHSNRTELHPEVAKLEPTDILSETNWGLASYSARERISFALLRGVPC